LRFAPVGVHSSVDACGFWVRETQQWLGETEYPAEDRSMPDRALTQVDRPQFRSFTLGDAMILIIALAPGLAFARPDIRVLARKIPLYPARQFLTAGVAVPLVKSVSMLMLKFLFFLLPAYLILRLKRPRVPFRSLIRQPGFAACAAPFAVFPLVHIWGVLAPICGLTGEVVSIGSQALFVVAAPLAWVGLIATRQWHAEPHWIDRLGRVMGACWMVSTLALFVVLRVSG
jgi:hypothetical protein